VHSSARAGSSLGEAIPAVSDVLDQCRDFLSAILEPADVVEFRTLKPVSKQWGTVDALPGILPKLVRLSSAGAQCYFGANPRKRVGESKEDG